MHLSVLSLFFYNIIRLFGILEKVLYDHDSRFTSKFWKDLWELLGTKVLFTSAHHPQIDGQVESTHYTIEQTLRCLLIELNLEKYRWVKLLPFVEFGINASILDNSGISP